MDAHTLDLLEFDKVRELLAGYSACSLGKELARQLEPSTDAAKVQIDLALVTEMTEALGMNQPPPFGGLHDVRLTVRRAAIGAMLTAEQLLEVADTLNCTGNMYRYRMRLNERFTRLAELLTPIEDLGPVAKGITGCIDGRGHVVDSASPELSKIRHQLADLEDRVQEQIKKLLRDPKLRDVLRYPNATVSGDHYVLPVAVNHRHKVPGIVHRTSATGETIFIEPAGVARLSAERTVLKGEEDREVKRILRRLTADVAKVAKHLTYAIDLMAKLDLVTAKAKFSRDFHMYAPDVNTEGQLWLRQARHPLLEHLFRHEQKTSESSEPDALARGETRPLANASGSERKVPSEPDALARGGTRPLANASGSERKVVPIDVRLGFKFNLIIITGPNTGGKTVALKTTGLLCLMAQCGMHIPAGEGSNVPIFKQIFADIGDEQSLQQSLSTFSSHISRIATILRTADEHSLVLLDELGAGTDPTEGAALGRAILDALDTCRCRAMVTTHLGDLKTYAFNNERAENAAVEFDIETLRPTYRLHIGQFGMSNALKIARRLKLPRDLLQRAQRYLRRRQRKAPELARLQELREEAQKAQEEAMLAKHEADKQREELEKAVAKMQREAEDAATMRDWRSRLQVNERVRVTRFDQPGRVVRVDHKRSIAVVNVGLGQWDVPLDEVFPLESAR